MGKNFSFQPPTSIISVASARVQPARCTRVKRAATMTNSFFVYYAFFAANLPAEFLPYYVTFVPFVVKSLLAFPDLFSYKPADEDRPTLHRRR